MYIPEKKLITRIGGELERRLPVLSHWKLSPETGRTDRSVDILATAKFHTQIYRFCFEVKRAGYPQYIRAGVISLKRFTEQNPSYYPVIVAPVISERGKKICDEYKVGYLDFSGSVKIANGGIFIFREGKERPRYADTSSRSLFSPKATRITKRLLGRPRLVWTQKDILRDTGLSKGMVSRIVNRMIDAGYLSEKDRQLSLVDFDDLLSVWVESEKRRRENKRNYYIWSQNPAALMRALAGKFSSNKLKYAFTQEAGASLVAPFAAFNIVSVYVRAFDEFPEKALSATEVNKGFNLTVIEAQDDDIFTTSQDVDGLSVVDNLQLYADLMKNPLRGEKQAAHILSIIKKAFL